MTGWGVLAAVAPAALLAGCGGEQDPGAPAREQSVSPATPPAKPTSPETFSSPADWNLASSGEGATLSFRAKGSEPAIRLFCPQGGESLLVNVPAFRPIGSEERMSFGSGGAAHALVADTRGDRRRGGVSASGPVSDILGALIAGPVSASYGAQVSGPHPAPPRALVRAFAEACRNAVTAGNVSACLVQDGERLTNPPLRAVGTEPFWAAQIEGRCVTYSHPDDQQGTRVWTRYAARSDGRSRWTGALEGRPFVLTTRPQAGCSDGMSDHRYPIAVELIVGGEHRRGCADGAR